MDGSSKLIMVIMGLIILTASMTYTGSTTTDGTTGKICIAEASECICENFYYKYRYKYVETESAWAEAYVEGYICSPSDGNVHSPSGYGTGGPILESSGFDYWERGCNGDLIRAWAIAKGYDGSSRVSASASLGAPPCCAT